MVRLLLAALAVTGVTAQAALYTNPVLNMDFPDPSITRAPDGTFFAYATMGNGHHLQVASSRNLYNWTYLGEAMPAPAPWTGGGCFWAPDVQRHGDTYFMYYAASTKDGPDGCTAMCIGVATSAAPGGPFVDAAPAPLVCDPSFAAIDPKSFDDPVSGATYLYWGSGGAPIMVRQLAPSRTAWADGSAAAPVLLPNASRPYESLVEGAWVHYHMGLYYLLTSGDACCGAGANYAIIASVSGSPTGPFLRRGDADGTGRDVLLAQAGNGSVIAAPGHNCLVQDDVDNDWLVYHGYVGGNRYGPRALQLDLLQWVTPNGTLSPVGTWPKVGAGTPSTTPQVVPYIKAPATAAAAAAGSACLRADLRVPPSTAFTSAGVYERRSGRLVRTLWSRRAVSNAAAETILAAVWDGAADSGVLVPECAGGSAASAALAYEVRALASNVTYVWEGAVGNSGKYQVGPDVLRAFDGFTDIDVAGSTAAVVTGYGERSKQWVVFDTRSPADTVRFLGHEDYHASFTHVAVDADDAAEGGVAYFMNEGVPAEPSSYYFSPWTWVAAVNLSTRCEYQFAFGGLICNEGTGQTRPDQVCNASLVNGTVPQGGAAWDGCNGAEQFYSSVIDVRQDTGVINATGVSGNGTGLAYPSTGTGIAVQRGSAGTLLAVAHGYAGVIAVFHKRTGAALGNVSVPGGVHVGAIRFTPDGAGLWALTSSGVIRYTGLAAGTLVAAVTVPASVLPAPAALGVDARTGAALVASTATQQVFVLDAATGAVLRTYGNAGGYSAATGPAVTPAQFSFLNLPYVSDDGAGGLYVSDQGNRRTLRLDAGGALAEEPIMFVSASYVSTSPHGAPERVFSNFLEFAVNYSVPLGAPGSWTLVRNWAAGVDASFFGHGQSFSGPTSLVQTAGGHTFGVVNVAPPDNAYVQALVELVLPVEGGAPGGMRVLRLCGYQHGYLPMGQLDASGSFHFSVEGKAADGTAFFEVWAAPLVIDAASGAANFSCAAPANYSGCVRLAHVNMSDPAVSLAPRSGFGAATLPLTRDGALVIFDASTQRNGGFHLGALDAASNWLWQASPWGAWTYAAAWETLPVPGGAPTDSVNVSVGYLEPDTVDGRYGANDATINYAGNVVLADAGGDSIVYGFHGEFWEDAEANQFVHFHAGTGLFVGQFGTPNKRDTNFSYPLYIVAGQAGNAFSPSLVRATGIDGAPALYVYHNDESSHDGVHRWRLQGVDEMQVLRGETRLS